MGYAFTDVRAFTDDVRALTDDVCALIEVRAVTGVGRPASAPHAGRPVRRDP
jgi:hypothetical protein